MMSGGTAKRNPILVTTLMRFLRWPRSKCTRQQFSRDGVSDSRLGLASSGPTKLLSMTGGGGIFCVVSVDVCVCPSRTGHTGEQRKRSDALVLSCLFRRRERRQKKREKCLTGRVSERVMNRTGLRRVWPSCNHHDGNDQSVPDVKEKNKRHVFSPLRLVDVDLFIWRERCYPRGIRYARNDRVFYRDVSTRVQDRPPRSRPQKPGWCIVCIA